jgi:hypothetical protein
MTPITEAELATLEAAKDDTEWNDACAVIKTARDGAFPSDWNEKVRVGGVMDRFIKRFGEYNGNPIQVVTPT